MDNTTLTAVIIEDESESLQLLEGLIASNGKAKVIGSTSNPAEAVNLIMSLNPNIVFLDVKMPEKSGFEVLDDLLKYKFVNPLIVFTTAYDEFAVRAFEYTAFDYLLKPVDPDRLATTLLKCAENRKANQVQNALVLLDIHKKLIYKDFSGIVFIDPAEIVCIEADGNYSVFKLSNGRTETITTLLGKVEKQLPARHFYRISRNYIINLDFIRRINSRKRLCILQCNKMEFKCEISQDKIKILADVLKNTN